MTDPRLTFTRGRDLVAVGLVAAVVGFLLVLAGYSSLPPLPRLAGLVPALLGVGEAVVGYGFRARIRDAGPRGAAGGPAASSTGMSAGGPAGPSRRPLPPSTAARALMAAKATSLAGAALLGLWIGLLAYVWPRSAQVLAAAADTPSALVGIVGALLMIGGGLYLEHCLRAPDPRR